MKQVAYVFYFIWTILFVCGCTQNKKTEEKSNTIINKLAQMDSMNRFDSLVNVMKISNNKQARILSRQALLVALQMNSEEALVNRQQKVYQ